MRRTAILASLLLLACLAVLAASAMGQTNPPAGGNGDWVVQDSTFWSDDLTLSGNLSVIGSGSLKLDNMTLVMNPATDGGLSIYVEAGSTLQLVNMNLRSSSASNHYWFEAQGKLVVLGSDVRDVASNEYRWDEWDNIVGGVQIYDGTSVLKDSDFHDCQRINVYVSEADILISNCEFFNAEYVSSYQYYYYSYEVGTYIQGYYTDATGLFLVRCDPNITLSTFRNNGLPSSALPYYTTARPYNGVMTFGRGILAYESAPNITHCTLNNNGEQPPDRTVEGVQQIFFERFFYDVVPEGGLVCVGSGARPMIWDSKFLTNDVFGIYGFQSGSPELVDRCQIASNRYLRGTTVYAPSGGIYLEDGSGTITVANSTASGNLVLANIWAQEATLHLINFTNSNNVVNNAYNIYLGGGNHLIRDSFLDGTPGLAYNIMISYSRNNQVPKLRILESEIVGALYAIYTSNYQGAYIFMANSTVRGTGQATFYLQSTTVDAVNCTFNPLRVEGYSYTSGSVVHIMYYLRVDVTWQNDLAVAGAFVQIKNTTKEFVYGGIADENGTVGPLIVTSRSIYVISGTNTAEVSNSPLYINAYSAGLSSTELKVVFIQNHIDDNKVNVVIRDDKPPSIYVFTPGDGHSQRTTSLEIRGMSTDVGAGINSTYVSTDEVEWTIVAGTEQTWNVTIELPEGVHTIWIRAIDNAGNEKEIAIVDVEIDLSAPLLEVLDPVKDTWFTSSVNYTLRGRVFNQATLIINRQLITVAPDGSWESTQEIHSGSNEFRISATDHVGNVQEIIKTIVRDSTVPKLVITSPGQDIWTNVSQVEVKGITELGATIRVNGEPIPTFDGRFASEVYLTEGLNEVVVEAVDKANNVMRVVRNVHLDSIPPLLRVEHPQGDMLTNERYLDIRGTIDDPTVGRIIINGLLVDVVDLAFSKQFRLDEGVNPIVIEAFDRASNYVVRRYNIVLDTTPPAIELQEPLGVVETRDPTIRVRGRVDVDSDLTMWGEPQHANFDLVYLVRLDKNFRYDTYPLVRGLNVIHIQAVDEVGNVAHTVLRVYHDLTPPELVISPTVDRTTEDIVMVRGLLLDGSELRMNGVPVVLGSSGEFSEAVSLKMGLNTIRVVASDLAGNQVAAELNITRYTEPAESEGIMGASFGLSVALIAIMLLIGMAIIYPGIQARRPRPKEGPVEEVTVGGPIPWGRGQGFPEIPPEPEPGPEEAAAVEVEPPPPPTRRPLPPPPPDHQQPSVPQKPPWR